MPLIAFKHLSRSMNLYYEINILPCSVGEAVQGFPSGFIERLFISSRGFLYPGDICRTTVSIFQWLVSSGVLSNDIYFKPLDRAVKCHPVSPSRICLT